MGPVRLSGRDSTLTLVTDGVSDQLSDLSLAKVLRDTCPEPHLGRRPLLARLLHRRALRRGGGGDEQLALELEGPGEAVLLARVGGVPLEATAATLPHAPAAPDNSSLRWSVRSDGRSGFLFVTNRAARSARIERISREYAMGDLRAKYRGVRNTPLRDVRGKLRVVALCGAREVVDAALVEAYLSLIHISEPTSPY